MRSSKKHIAIAIVALAVAATPAMAGKSSNALRSAPAKAGKPGKSAVWTPSPSSGIKWTGNGGRWAVWIR